MEPLDQFYERISADVPLRRPAESREVGDLVALLASARAAYIAGARINLEGGRARGDVTAAPGLPAVKSVTIS